MATKSHPKIFKSKANPTEPMVFLIPSHSRYTPTSITGWGEDDRSSLIFPYPMNESKIVLKKEIKSIKKQIPKISNSSQSMIKTQSYQSASNIKRKSDQWSQSPKNKDESKMFTKKEKQFLEVGQNIERKTQTNFGNKTQPLIFNNVRNRPGTSYLLKAPKKQAEYFPFFEKPKEAPKERKIEKSVSFLKLKNHILELNHPIFSSQSSMQNFEQSPCSFAKDYSRSPPRIPSPTRSRGDSEEFRGRPFQDGVIPFSHPQTPTMIKRRIPAGCMKAVSAPKQNLIRKTYMGISRLTTGNAPSGGHSHRSSCIGEAVPNGNQWSNDSAVFLGTMRDEKAQMSRTFSNQFMTSQNDIVLREERFKQEPHATHKRGSLSLNEKGAQTERLRKSMIPIPYDFENLASNRESPRDQNQKSFIDKPKIPMKDKRYRPKSFLKMFKPKVKQKIPNGELCVQAITSENPNSSLIG